MMCLRSEAASSKQWFKPRTDKPKPNLATLAAPNRQETVRPDDAIHPERADGLNPIIDGTINLCQGSNPSIPNGRLELVMLAGVRLYLDEVRIARCGLAPNRPQPLYTQDAILYSHKHAPLMSCVSTRRRGRGVGSATPQTPRLCSMGTDRCHSTSINMHPPPGFFL